MTKEGQYEYYTVCAIVINVEPVVQLKQAKRKLINFSLKKVELFLLYVSTEYIQENWVQNK